MVAATSFPGSLSPAPPPPPRAREERGGGAGERNPGNEVVVAVHFTAISCEPNRAITTLRKPYFEEINPCTNKIVYARFEVFRSFLCVFISGFRIYVR